MYKKTIEDNFFRDKLLSIYKKSKGKPVIISGIYTHSENKTWATFKKIKPYLINTKTNILCNHLNIRRKEINRHFTISENDNGERFIIIAKVIKYNFYGRERVGVELFEDDKDIISFLNMKRKNTITKDTFNKCYFFDKNDLS